MMMAALNPSHAILFLLLLFSLKLKTTISCPEIEKQSLLSFKQSLEDPDNALSSWDSEVNCCEWKGVFCSNLTGHVHQLHIHSNTYTQGNLSGKIDPTLVNLKHLRYLDLSLNNFAQTIPSFIGSFTNLEYLNLSYARFHGKIPHTLGNLSKLHTLDLAGYLYGSVNLNVDRVEWLSGLPKLEYLNMNNANMSRATEWAQVINTLPSLLQLHFKHCSLVYVASLDDVINITSLTFLDLSYNDYQFTSLPAPAWIFQLINLVSLDLSLNLLTGPIPSISNATKLQYIDLSFNIFNYGSIPDWLFSCRVLEFLSLAGNRDMHTSTIRKGIGNLTSLNVLDLSSSRFSGKIPGEIFKLCKLKQLDFSMNELQGDISELFGKMSECISQTLEILYLDNNHFSGQLTVDFKEIFKNLRILSLGGNSLSGAIPTSLGKLSSLEFLSLQGNSLSGAIPTSLGKLSSLKILYLGVNSLSGAIPTSLGKLSSLEILYLGGNKFAGNFPVNFGQLSNLKGVYIGNNMLEGVVSEAHFANLTKLETFDAYGNHLTLKVGANWIPPFQLVELDLGSWNLGPSFQILSWLETQKNIWYLDLSNAGISGNIPLWILDSRFSYLNLSHNHLHGNIPYIGRASLTYLSSNKFSGALPLITDSIQELDLSDNSFSRGLSHFLCNNTYPTNELAILHLGGNELGGELPDCWMKWPWLKYLNLGNNNIHGSIPTSFGYLADLWSLNLYGNKFTGQLPFSMHNCTELLKIDLSNNRLNGIIPTWMGANLVELQFLILRSNKLSGEIPSEICYLNYLQILDLSHNTFSGIIPSCVENLTAMATKKSLDSVRGYSNWKGNLIESASIATKGRELLYDTILDLVTSFDLSRNNLSGEIPKELMSLVELRTLNLSQNHLTGSIPEKIGDMKQLESLDLSRNSLSGQIPNSITLISSLSYLNLSYNNFTGKIPQGTQLQGFDASSFIGNNLCGPPLSNCSHDSDQVSGHKDEDDESDESHEIEWLYVFISSGYAVGVSIVVSVLVLNKSWREAYFELLKSMWDKIYVFVCVNWRRLIKPSTTSS